MDRREFLKYTIIGGLSIPQFLKASTINFDKGLMNDYKAKTIVIFLYGGASELGGNLTNMQDIKQMSLSSYPIIESTKNGFWKNSGGDLMENMITNKTLSIVRTIYRKNDTRSHPTQQIENQKGSSDLYKSGFFADILYAKAKNGLIDTTIPSILAGDSYIFDIGNYERLIELNPISFDSTLANPYVVSENKSLKSDNEKTLFNELVKKSFESKNNNLLFQKIKENFYAKEDLAKKIEEINKKDLGVTFANTSISNTLKSALKIMASNPQTTLGFINFGGWDDHSGAVTNYEKRHKELIEALNSSSTYLKNNNEQTINIWVLTEFGRNVNLNASLGWDHGNNFNCYLVSNSNKFQLGKIIGSTEVYKEGTNRLYTRPAKGSVSYEPYAIASTISYIHGLKNSEVPTIKELL